MVAIAPSHQVDQIGDRVIIRGLELFVGFDKSIDDPDDKRIKKYDKKAVQAVVARTEQYIARNQHPKLILGHNDSESDGSHVRPVIGDISNLQVVEIGEAFGIAGDVEMSNDDFQTYLKTNSFPRRSAEIWPDGFMSEVALLGSETPARPLPDTKFTRSTCDVQAVDHFSRTYPGVFAEPTESMHGPGPGSTHIPTAGKKRKKGYEMPSDEDKTKMAELEDENKKLKAKLAKFQEDDDDDKEKNQHDDEDDKDKNEDDDKKEDNRRVNSLQKEVAQFKRQAAASTKQLVALSDQFTREKMGHQLDLMAQQGYRVGDTEGREELLNRIVQARDPEAELQYFTKLLIQDPINLMFDQRQVHLGSGGGEASIEAQRAASDRAVKRCEDEAKPELFTKYYNEEIEAA